MFRFTLLISIIVNRSIKPITQNPHKVADEVQTYHQTNTFQNIPLIPPTQTEAATCECAARAAENTEITHYLIIYLGKSHVRVTISLSSSRKRPGSDTIAHIKHCLTVPHTYTAMPARPIKTQSHESTNTTRQTGHSSCWVLRIPQRS